MIINERKRIMKRIVRFIVVFFAALIGIEIFVLYDCLYLKDYVPNTGVEEAREWIEKTENDIKQTVQESAPSDNCVIVVNGLVQGEDCNGAEYELVERNTEIVYSAIKKVHSMGGGTVEIPEGVFPMGPIHLLSNVNLHLDEGCTIKFAPDPELYAGSLTEKLYGEKFTDTYFEGVELLNYSPFIYANGETNVALTGKGILDGQAQNDGNWIIWKSGEERVELNAKNVLFSMAEEGLPVKERIFGDEQASGRIRPNMIQFINCSNVEISGITILNPPCWQIHLVLSSCVIVKNVTFDSNTLNDDGIDVESSRNVLITDNLFRFGTDDSIAVKSGRNQDGEERNTPSEYVVIRDNYFEGGSTCVSIGSEVTGGANHIAVIDNVIDGSSYRIAFDIRTNKFRGGRITDCFYLNNEIRGMKEAGIVFRINCKFREDDELNKQKEREICISDIYIGGLQYNVLDNEEIRARSIFSVEKDENQSVSPLLASNSYLGEAAQIADCQVMIADSVISHGIKGENAGVQTENCRLINAREREFAIGSNKYVYVLRPVKYMLKIVRYIGRRM